VRLVGATLHLLAGLWGLGVVAVLGSEGGDGPWIAGLAASAILYLAICLTAPFAWVFKRHRRQLLGMNVALVFVSAILSGSPAGFLLYGPAAVVLLLMFLIPREALAQI